IKNPGRGGQNLSERFRRLENTIRGKDAFAKKISALSQTLNEPSTSARLPGGPQLEKNTTFSGFIIPEEPKPPADDECCMSGCAICVYDLYEDSLTAYKESVASLRSSLVASGIPEYEWPSNIRHPVKEPGEKKTNVSLSAFEEMERALREKRAR
ncbi:hypothetical protein BV22DRAFT_994447, partial [Leucogyrophana mollusca]